MRHGVRRQRFNAEQDDRQQRHQHRPYRHHEREPRRLRKFEDHPDSPKRGVGRPRQLLGAVALRSSVLFDRVWFKLVEDQLVEEDVVWNGVGAPQPAAALVIDENRLEARAMPVEEKLASLAVVERRASEAVSKQRARMAFQHSEIGFKVVTANVDANPMLGRLSPATAITKKTACELT